MDISDKYILIDIFTGRHMGEDDFELTKPLIFDTLEEAREAIKKVLIFDVMNGEDESIFDEYTKYEDYEWEPDCIGAWFANDRGRSDWMIYSIADLVKHTEKIRQEEGTYGR